MTTGRINQVAIFGWKREATKTTAATRGDTHPDNLRKKDHPNEDDARPQGRHTPPPQANTRAFSRRQSKRRGRPSTTHPDIPKNATSVVVDLYIQRIETLS